MQNDENVGSKDALLDLYRFSSKSTTISELAEMPSTKWAHIHAREHLLEGEEVNLQRYSDSVPCARTCASPDLLPGAVFDADRTATRSIMKMTHLYTTFFIFLLDVPTKVFR